MIERDDAQIILLQDGDEIVGAVGVKPVRMEPHHERRFASERRVAAVRTRE